MELKLEPNLTEQKHVESRRHPRLDVDLGTLIEFNLPTDNSKSSYKALILDGSFGGCGIVTVNKDAKLLKENDICYVKVPEENHIIIKTKIIWVKEINNNVFRLGLEYID